MGKKHQFLDIFLVLLLFAVISAAGSAGQKASDWKRPLVSPSALLIYDKAVRAELKVTREQIQQLDQLCLTLDPLLFSMRDVGAGSKDKKAYDRAGRIAEALKQLDLMLNDRQQQRLGQLVLQYQGTESLLDPRVQSPLRLTDDQISQLQVIHRQSQTRLQQVADEQSAHEAGWAQKRTELILQQKSQKITDTLTKDQRRQWVMMLGGLFDFSQTSPVFFHAPDLTNVTEWINTRPVSMKDLRGRVVVVHFFTFGCSNCIENYPVYKQWTKKYDPKEVFVLGIHTPEAPYEKDTKKLRKQMDQEGLSFAVAVDNQRANWDAWSNRVWPSVYLVDKTGRVRYWWYGELKWQGATGDKWVAERIQELRAEPYPAS